MSDLIRRDEALKAIVDERTHTLLQAWINVKKTVPSVDAIEVVRCKDCKHREKCEQMVVFENGKYITSGYKLDYCSYGEREGE